MSKYFDFTWITTLIIGWMMVFFPQFYVSIWEFLLYMKAHSNHDMFKSYIYSNT